MWVPRFPPANPFGDDDDNDDPGLGIWILKHLLDVGVAVVDPTLEEVERPWHFPGKKLSQSVFRRDFINADVVEAMLYLLPSFEFRSRQLSDRLGRRIHRRNPKMIKGMANRIAAELGGEASVRLSSVDSEALEGINEILDGLTGLSEYVVKTGHDIYAFKHYMPLLLTAALRDKVTYTALRSFSLALPVIDSTESCSHCHASFAEVRNAILPRHVSSSLSFLGTALNSLDYQPISRS